jgi:hypothetical protein
LASAACDDELMTALHRFENKKINKWLSISIIIYRLCKKNAQTIPSLRY